MSELPRGFLALPSAEDTTMARLTRKLRLLVLQQLLTTPPRSVPPPTSGALSRLQPFVQQLATDKGQARVLLEHTAASGGGGPFEPPATVVV